ncbi:1-phosphatidylinositol phosphodiesterase-like [Ptychodera flava]|uniref:1-phosphatidylinositol phosphodiesterase-like n=1 Tax=Ptychodera flava TaxID=63121 RepID=UPI00396A5B2A
MWTRNSLGKMTAKHTVLMHVIYLALVCNKGGANGVLLRPDYNTGKIAGISYPDWMSNLNDDISLASLSIPGTYNTMTYNGYGGHLAQCQSWTLGTQLEAGIRFLDIRCRHFRDGLLIHKGVYFQHLGLYDVLQDVTDFLKHHPREVVLMRVKKEHLDAINTRSMEETFRSRYISQFNSKYFWTTNRIPNLGEARGKIVILDDFANGRVGVNYSDAEIADDREVFSLQPREINAKWNSIRNNLNKASDDRSDQLFLTYTSGRGRMIFEYEVADLINPKLMKFIKRNPGKKKWGTVVMDFPGGALVEKILMSND